MRNKESGFQFSWSHFVMASAILAFLLIEGFGISCTVYCFANGYFDLAAQILPTLFTVTGAFSAVAISYYEWKAKNENQAKINNAKYDKRIDLATRICDNLRDGTIDIQSVAVLKEIISDGQTSISVNSTNGTITTVEDTKFTASNPYDVDDILDEFPSGGMG